MSYSIIPEEKGPAPAPKGWSPKRPLPTANERRKRERQKSDEKKAVDQPPKS